MSHGQLGIAACFMPSAAKARKQCSRRYVTAPPSAQTVHSGCVPRKFPGNYCYPLKGVSMFFNTFHFKPKIFLATGGCLIRKRTFAISTRCSLTCLCLPAYVLHLVVNPVCVQLIHVSAFLCWNGCKYRSVQNKYLSGPLSMLFFSIIC